MFLVKGLDMKLWVLCLSFLILACGSQTLPFDNHALVVSTGGGLMNLQIYDQSFHILPILPGVQVGDTLNVVLETREGVLEVRVEGR